ncbi:MAG: iron-sulfur cluster assembly scaffold protein [Candidatus Syntrophoarchaeum sp.]|nr:iron-sulfur cluster assembly scaffold protein [Candidatus Syntrophoarchaeum sp.]
MTAKASTLDEIADEIQRSIIEDALKEFSERVVEEAINPRNVGRIESPDGEGRITGSCGDTVTISLKVDHDRIVDIRFLTDGCGPTIASASVLTQLVKGKTIEEASRIEDQDIMQVLGELPEDHLHCPVLAVNTLKEAIEDYRRRSVEA